MAATALSGPRKIIELDGKPEQSWHLDSTAVHLWKGKLWKWEPIGCILCIEQEGIPHETLSTEVDEDGETQYCCMTHGALQKIPYTMEKKFRVTLGGITRDGFETVTDAMLFPQSMDEEEKNSLICRLLDEIEEEEHEDAEDASLGNDDAEDD